MEQRREKDQGNHGREGQLTEGGERGAVGGATLPDEMGEGCQERVENAVQRLFERNISIKSVREALQNGEIIEDYSAELPEPGHLRLAFQGKRPFHMVTSVNPAAHETIVITVYIPDPYQWNKDFKSRRR